MDDGTIWTKELKWPKSGPLHWLAYYLLAVTCAGLIGWIGLGFVRPTVPDFAAGLVYQVPGGRKAPDFFVTREEAYGLRIAAAHLGLLCVIGCGVALWNMGARTPPEPD